MHNFEWYHYIGTLLLLVLLVITFTYFQAMFLTLRYMGISESLDRKLLKIKSGILINKLKSLDSKESIEKELKEVRELEVQLKEETQDFSLLIKEWEETTNKVKDRGYI